MRNFLIRAGISLGIAGIPVLLVLCLLYDQSGLGLILMAVSLIVIGVTILLLTRSRKSRTDEIDPISDSGRIARFSKHVATRNVYENTSDIWNTMTDDIPDQKE